MIAGRDGRRLWLSFLCSLATIAVVTSATASDHNLVTCSPESIGVDTSLATTSGEVILGMAWGQTFLASDTLILSVTVWRIRQEALTDSSDMKFWLTTVDTSTGYPCLTILREGPVMWRVSPDTTRPTSIEYDFDPPISLPRPGQYAFWVQEPCSGYFDLLIDPHDDYAGGHLWNAYRSIFSGCVLACARSLSFEDLAFQIVFCDTSTPVRNHTWGDLKVRYR